MSTDLSQGLPPPRLSVRVTVDAARRALLDAEPAEPELEHPPSRRSPRAGQEGEGERPFGPEARPDPPPLSLDAWAGEPVALQRAAAPVVGLAKTARGGGTPTEVLSCQAAAALVAGAPLAELTPAAANAKNS